MTKLTAFFTAIYFSLLALFGVPFTPDDLKPGEKSTSVATKAQLELFREVFETETQWLASMQLSNGAMPMTCATDGELRVNPYFSDIAVLALLDDARRYKENAVRYMDWHFAHLNTAQEDFNGLDGTIYDYVITMKNGEIVQEKISMPEGGDSYDSTDSYAATFLCVVNKYVEKTGDVQYAISHKDELVRIADVMYATLHKGLTYAKPNHKVKYLMDNCEVYEGALAAAKLFEVIALSDSEVASMAHKCSDLAVTVKENINLKFWNFGRGGYYTPEMTLNGIPTKVFSWNKYYPQATAQLFPITSGVIEPETQRAKDLYNRFSENYNWETFEYPDAFCWGNNVLAAATMKDIDSVETYMKAYKPLMKNHSWPLYNADSARVVMAAYIIISNAKA